MRCARGSVAMVILANLVRQLVSVLDRRRHFDCALPVEIQMAEFVAQFLLDVGWKMAFVEDDVVVSGAHGALVDRLGD